MLVAPALLGDAHMLDDFDSGVSVLDEWLRRRARANQASGASRTYVVADGERVAGYYCIASGALDVAAAPGPIRRNMPDPVPMAVLGRLAVDRRFQGMGFGVAMLQDAVQRTAQAAGILGIRGILVHAISEEAARFYARHGFQASPSHPMTLVLSIRGLAA